MKERKCAACGLPGGCRTVAEAAKCANNTRSTKNKAFRALTILLLVAGCWWLLACARPAEPTRKTVTEYYANLPEAKALKILEAGTEQGREYLVTKNADGTFTVQQVNARPQK
jgi:hypothetical protein